MESPPRKRLCLTKSIPQGEILTDLRSKKWKLGPAVGIGGFGEIYLGKYISYNFDIKQQMY